MTFWDCVFGINNTVYYLWFWATPTTSDCIIFEYIEHVNKSFNRGIVNLVASRVRNILKSQGVVISCVEVIEVSPVDASTRGAV